jgi:WD40 repeat protein
MLVGEREEHDLSWLDGSYARSMSDDGGSLAFDEEGSAGRVTASVYLRKAGGATPIRLGDGFAIAISPDGRWVLASYRHTNPRELWALPTGPGEPVRLPTNGIDFVEAASWFPDSRRVAVLGAEPNRAQRTWAFKLDGGKPEPLTPEGMFGWLLSPDGKYVVALDARTRKRLLFPTAGGDPVALTAAAAGLPMRFTPDGRSLFVHRGSIPAEVYRVDLTANRATLVRTLMPPDPAGLIAMTVNGMAVSGDGKYYAYTSLRRQDDLYLVSNVK